MAEVPLYRPKIKRKVVHSGIDDEEKAADSNSKLSHSSESIKPQAVASQSVDSQVMMSEAKVTSEMPNSGDFVSSTVPSSQSEPTKPRYSAEYAAMSSVYYEPRVKRKVVPQPFEPLAVPEAPSVNSVDSAADKTGRKKRNLWLWTVLLTLLTVVAFSVVDAVLMIQMLFSEAWYFGALLASVLGVLVWVLLALIWREYRGLKQLRQVKKKLYPLAELKTKGEVDLTLRALRQRHALQSASPFADQCYQQFFQLLRHHHTHAEMMQLYQQTVCIPMQQAAKRSLKRQSMAAGAIGLVSPNGFLQSLGVLWVSLRTLREIALVYGIQPQALSSLQLLRLALENLAAASLTDLLTDELATQLGGTLGDKVLANSVDAAALIALNRRLGKALIRELEASLF